MNLTDNQLWTLDQLGIPVWRQRQVTGQDLNDENPTDDAVFVCHSSLLLCVPETINPPEQQLWTNICKVIDGLSLSSEQCPPAMLSKLTVDDELPQQIFIFGNSSLSHDAALANRCVTLPSLDDLIREPAQKAVVWSAICQLQQQAS